MNPPKMTLIALFLPGTGTSLLILLGCRKEMVFSEFLQIWGHCAQRTNSCRVVQIVVTLYFNIIFFWTTSFPHHQTMTILNKGR